MLSGQMVSMLITSGVVCGVLGFLGAVTYCKKKNINIDKGVDTVNNVVKAAEPVINIASTLLPDNPAVNVLKIAEKWATIGAGYAEQLCHADEINKDERAMKAEEVANAALKELNIDVDDNKKLLINAAIENIVGSFGHTEPTEAEKQAQLQQLQTENAKLLAENTNLKNAITTAASTVQIATQTA